MRNKTKCGTYSKISQKVIQDIQMRKIHAKKIKKGLINYFYAYHKHDVCIYLYCVVYPYFSFPLSFPPSLFLLFPL